MTNVNALWHVVDLVSTEYSMSTFEAVRNSSDLNEDHYNTRDT